MKNLLKRYATVLLLLLCCAGVGAKSLVVRLNDAKGTRLFFKISSANYPKMTWVEEGTLKVNFQTFELENVKNFYISSTDYSGEANTIDAISLVEDEKVALEGPVNIYTIDGRLVGEGMEVASLKGLGKGAYVITDGKTTIKIMKR